MKKLMLITCLFIATPAMAANFAVAPSSGNQPVKAQVVDSNPAHFEINLKKAANMGVNQKAPTFAMYTTDEVPGQCGDFTKDSIAYQKPDKYHRVFNLTQKPEVLSALKQYGCVIIKNKPTLPSARS